MTDRTRVFAGLEIANPASVRFVASEDVHLTAGNFHTGSLAEASFEAHLGFHRDLAGRLGRFACAFPGARSD
jgi:hypothetical protein